LPQVLKCGTEPCKNAVAKRVAEDVVSLSADQFGRYVVEACILETSPLPLQRVLAAVLALSDDQLAELVQGRYSNGLVRTLLKAGTKVSITNSKQDVFVFSTQEASTSC
jgi:hypothetical protein